MTEGSIWKKIIKFAVPVFIGHLFQQMYNTADSLIVGNYVGSNALAAVSSTGSIIYFIIGFFMGFSMGSGVIIARFIGAQDDERTSAAVHTTFAMGIIMSINLTLLGVLFSPMVLRWMGTPAEVLADASLYLRIYFGGAAGLIMYNTLVGILQASGDSKHPLYYLICSSLINIVLDVFLIAYLHMGVAGAALATVISQFLSMFLALRQLMYSEGAIRLDLKNIRIDRDILKEIFYFGFPTALQGCVIDLSNILIQSYINSFGSLAMAGIGAYSKVEGFAFLPVTAFSMALSTFVSQNLGAGKKDRMHQGMRFGLTCSVVTIELIGLFFFLYSPVLIRFFSTDPKVIAFGAGRAKVCALFYCLLGFSHVMSAVMRGIGRPMVPMVVMLVCWCAVRVAVFMTIGQVWHVIGLTYWIYPFTWGLSACAYYIYMKYLQKKGVW